MFDKYRSNRKTREWEFSASEEEIRARAYDIWKSRNSVETSPEEDWNAAIESLRTEYCLDKGMRWLWRMFSNPVGQKFALELEKLRLDKVKNRISALGLLATAIAGIGLGLNYCQSQDRLITDRFAKAIEQLGNQSISVRSGGIYALERIAKDSPKDRATILEILLTFVREKSLLIKGDRNQRQQLTPISADVQSVLRVVGRLDKRELNLDLSEVNLRGAKLYSGNFDSAILYDTNLTDAKLDGTSLRSSNLNGAKLFGASLKFVKFDGAKLNNTFLKGADLSGARGLTDAQLAEANLCETRMPNGEISNRNCSKY